MKVLLVVAPFAGIERPALGVSLLKSRLTETGHSCEVAYLNLAFAHVFGRAKYERLVWDLPFRALVGEWVFAGCLYGDMAPPAEEYVDEVLRRRWSLSAGDILLAMEARRVAPAFIDDVVATMPWHRHDVVGFSSCTAQNLASLALAVRVKELDPGVTTIFGGANCQGDSGLALLRRFEDVDYICQGDAETSLPDLLEWLKVRDVSPSEQPGIPGVGYRDCTGRVAVTPGVPTSDMDGLPLPDFADYYAALQRYRDAGPRIPQLSAESSRGCWWASSGPCGFCGMDAQDRAYRSKSPLRVLGEIRELVGKWPCSMVYLADTVVSRGFLREVVPALADHPLSVPVFCDVRPTITRAQVEAMGKARIHIQPGIESFSNRVLTLMHKGTRGLENVRLLKWCAAFKVKVSWNILYGFPGETVEDYEAMYGMMRALRFLPPPEVAQALSVDRYSPFFERPEDHGFANVRPLEPYRHLYPFDDEDLADLAYAFDYGCAPGTTLPDVAEQLRTEVDAWRRESGRGVLRYGRDSDDVLALVDLRPGAAALRWRLEGVERDVYVACEDICARDDLEKLPSLIEPDDRRKAGELDRVLDGFLGARVMVTDGRSYLSLALPDPWGWTPEPRE